MKKKRKSKPQISKLHPYSGLKKNKKAVAGIGIYQKFENILDQVEYLNKNIMRIKTNIGRIHFISIYASDMSKPKKGNRNIFKKLQNAIDKFSNNEKIFIIGDFNSK